MPLIIVKNDLLSTFLGNFPADAKLNFQSLKDAELSTLDFSFYTAVASVYSSKIEGENIDLDSYIKHKRDKFQFEPDYTKKIDDLYAAYQFAQKNRLNAESIAEAHRLLSKHFVAPNWQGKFRIQNMYVTSEDGKIDYVAVSPFAVSDEMKKLYNDISTLLETELTFEETFFYAAMIHLIFVKIHPWIDGNGRCARLIEKWFLAEKLGTTAWFLQNEKNYFKHQQLYYSALRKLGIEYDTLDYSKSMPFLQILPNCLK